MPLFCFYCQDILFCKNDSIGYLGFVLYGTAVYEDAKPLVQAASTPVLRQLRRLCCERLIYSGFALPQPLLSASYCMIYCCSTAKLPDRL